MRYVYCQPLFDERKCAHRFSYQLKKVFQANGLTLERFDYCGTGESEGEFADVSMESLLGDIGGYIGGEEASLIGLRFGASLAFNYCVKNSGQVKNLILMEPVTEGAKYVDYLFRKQGIKDLITGKLSPSMREDGYKNLEGYKTSIKFIEQIKNLYLVEMAKRCRLKNSVLVVQISNRLKINPETASLWKQLESSAKKASLENVKLPTFWERMPNPDYSELMGKVLRWCNAG